MNRIGLSVVFLTSIVTCIVSVADAKLYKWVDANGVTHYSNVVSPQNEGTVHSGAEAESSHHSNTNLKGLENVLDSYKKDGLTLDSDTMVEAPNRRTSDSGEADKQYHKKKAAYYKHELEGEQLDLKAQQGKLDRYKRKSYSDARHHKEIVRNYEDSVIRSKNRIEKLKHEYDYHKKKSR